LVEADFPEDVRAFERVFLFLAAISMGVGLEKSVRVVRKTPIPTVVAGACQSSIGFRQNKVASPARAFQHFVQCYPTPISA
jgi:hypothetical protein